jgi:uncharacterized protein YmfQ (DUF2313 family)
MGITSAPEEQYAASVRALFPRGAYWDRQFAGSESDCALFCAAQAAGIARFRRRMADLFRECDWRTAAETLGDWERVVLGRMNANLPDGERQAGGTVQPAEYRVRREAVRAGGNRD